MSEIRRKGFLRVILMEIREIVNVKIVKRLGATILTVIAWTLNAMKWSGKVASLFSVLKMSHQFLESIVDFSVLEILRHQYVTWYSAE